MDGLRAFHFKRFYGLFFSPRVDDKILRQFVVKSISCESFSNTLFPLASMMYQKKERELSVEAENLIFLYTEHHED